MNIYASLIDNPLIILLIIIAVFGVVAIITFIIYRYLHPKLKEEKPDEETFVQEEIDRVLQPVEDEETAKQINDYKEKNE